MGTHTNLWLLFFFGMAIACVTLSLAESQQPYFEESDDDFGDFDNEEEGFTNRAKPKVKQPDVTVESETIEEVVEDGVPEPQIVMAEMDDEDATVESEDEFSHLNDEEEFIGFTSESNTGSAGAARNQPKKETVKEPKITIANVPLHLRSNWDSFYLELILFALLLVYFTNFSVGRNKNFKLASAWFESHKTLLMQQFALVGDDGKAANDNNNSNGTTTDSKGVVSTVGGCAGLQKESENMYTLYCSGRVCVHSMMVELKFIKRQDLASLIMNVIRPTTDEVVIKLRLDDMDTFVLCVAAKKASSKYVKEMTDITTYCPGEKKTPLPVKQYNNSVSNKFVVWSEIGEVCQALLGEQRTAAVLAKHLHRVNYIHISDQYAGPKQPDQDQQQVNVERLSDVQKMPEVHKMLIVSLQMSGGVDGKKGATPEDMENLRPVMMLVLHLADKLYRFRLSKEGKAKAQRNRSRMEEAFHKATHAARAERAQGIREEKKREAREKIMECDDPEKQRKWEEKENKRAAKRKQPKMKQLKVT